MVGKEWYTVSEVAEMFGMSVDFVWSEIAKQRLVSAKFGRHRRINKGDLMEYVERGKLDALYSDRG